MKQILICISIFGVFSCKKNEKRFLILTINNPKDSCYYLRDSADKINIKAFRKMEIIENTFSDSVNIGFAIIPKGYIGKISYLRIGNNPQDAIYLGTNEKDWPTTEMICLNLYLEKNLTGEIKIKYFY